jgi:hypothetical protein
VILRGMQQMPDISVRRTRTRNIAKQVLLVEIGQQRRGHPPVPPFQWTRRCHCNVGDHLLQRRHKQCSRLGERSAIKTLEPYHRMPPCDAKSYLTDRISMHTGRGDAIKIIVPP